MRGVIASIDIRVLNALENHDLWKAQARPTSARGYFAVRANEVALHLKLDEDAVAESLSRLAASGKVLNIGGTMKDRTPRYHFVHF